MVNKAKTVKKWLGILQDRLKAGMTEDQVEAYFSEMYDDIYEEAAFQVNRELRDQKNRRGW
jgi:hypothetical protein